jgi:hypothetical protein
MLVGYRLRKSQVHLRLTSPQAHHAEVLAEQVDDICPVIDGQGSDGHATLPPPYAAAAATVP